MKEMIVLYNSKFGPTEKYADWLADEFDSDLISTKEADIKDVKQYDIIVLGGDIIEGKIGGMSFIRKNFEELKDKEIVVFAVGATPKDEKNMPDIVDFNFKDLPESIPCFYCPGKWIDELMTFKDRLMSLLLKRTVYRRRNRALQPWESSILHSDGANLEWTSKENLAQVIEYIDRIY